MNDTIFDLDEIKYKLKFISQSTDYDEFYVLLIDIIKPTETAYINRLFLTRNRFKKEYSDFENNAFDYDFWSARRNRIDFSLLETFDALESHYLKEDCFDIIEDYITRKNVKEEGETIEIAEPAETFTFPESTQDIVIPKTEELTDAERQQYKRLLIQCQDDIAIQAYARAYDYCNKAREAIEPESAQLYEYLLLTYIKKEGIEKIIQETIKGDKTKFEQILLFIQRCKKYQNSPNPKCPSNTLAQNFQKIAKDFATHLKVEHRRIKSDWVLYTEGVSSADDRQIVQNIMNLYKDIYTEIHNTEVFLSEMYFEICGAGKFQWIKLGKN
jgi:hypothetical protein